MPALQVEINPCRDGQQLFHGTIIRAGAKLRRDQVADDGGVKGVAGQRQSCIADDALLWREFNPGTRADADKREVTGAAAEIGHQNHLFMVERALIEISRAHRLKFKFHMLEPTGMKRGGHAGDAKGFIFRSVGAGEAHGTADSNGIAQWAEFRFSFRHQLFHDDADKILKRIRTPADHGGSESTVRSKRLHRLDQTPFVFVFQILGNGGWAGVSATGRPGSAANRRWEIKDGTKAFSETKRSGKLRDLDRRASLRKAVVIHDCQTAVCGPEIQADVPCQSDPQWLRCIYYRRAGLALTGLQVFLDFEISNFKFQIFKFLTRSALPSARFSL